MSKLSLRARLAIIFGVVVATSVVVCAIAEYSIARDAMLDRLETRELPLLLDSVVRNVEQEVERPVQIAHGIAENAYVLDFIARGEPESELPALAAYLDRVKSYSGAITTFVVSNRTGGYYTGAGRFRTLDPNRERDDWFYQFLRARQVRDLSFDVDEVSGSATVFVNFAIGGDPNAQLGAAGVGLELDGLAGVVRRARGESGRDVYLVDATGTIQVHADASRVHSRLDPRSRLGRAVFGGAGRIHVLDVGGRREFVASRLIPDAGWYVVVEMPQDEILAPLDTTLYRALGLAVGLALVSVVIGLSLGRRFAADLLDRAEQAELIDHMGQALVVFDSSGRVFGRSSRRAIELFGRTRLESSTAQSLLFPDALEYDVEASSFADWFTAAFTIPVDRWDEVASLAPRDVVLRRDDDEIRLEVEFRPIVVEGAVARVMMLATDVTAEYRLEQMRKAEQSAHAKELASMRQLVGGGSDNFIAFLRQSDQRLAVIAEAYGDDHDQLDAGEVETLFRHAHTVRGEARVFAQTNLESAVVAIEDRLVTLRLQARDDGHATTTSIRGLARAEVELARAELERSRDTFVEVSPLGRAALDRVTVRRSDVDTLARLVERSAGRLGEEEAAFRSVVSRLDSRPFGELVQVYVDSIPRWAEQAGKRAVFAIEGKDVAIPAALVPALRAAVVHLVRNAIAHGIERPSERTASGKDRYGRITARAVETNGQVTISVGDDGAGVDLDALVEKAKSLDLAVPENRFELLFSSGLSTKQETDDLAGRGVGLAAVREELREAGYAIAVDSTRGEGTTFRITQVVGSSLRPSAAA